MLMILAWSYIALCRGRRVDSDYGHGQYARAHLFLVAQRQPVCPTMWVLEAILLVVLPYGMAIICGAVTEAAGKLVSGYCSLGGLALGIYFFEKHAASFGGLITRDHRIGHPTMSGARPLYPQKRTLSALCQWRAGKRDYTRCGMSSPFRDRARQLCLDTCGHASPARRRREPRATHVNRPRPVSVRHELFTIGPKKVRPTANEKRFLSNFASDSA